MSEQPLNESRGLSAQGLACVRGGRRVFEGIDFSVAPGAALLLHGPNGSGKTSLLRMVAGFLTPAEGKLTWNGHALDEAEDGAPLTIAYAGHLDAVKPALTVAENLSFWADIYGGGGPGVMAALDRLGIDHLAGIPARFLSAGQRRRLGLARLAAAPASLWLLDEPTVTLDEASVRSVEALMADHRAAGGAVMVATHAGISLPGAETLTLGAAS